MTHEILSVKLCELEDQFSRLSSRIHLSETASRPQLRREIQALRRECAETELTLRTKLRHSHGELTAILANSFKDAEQIIQQAGIELQKLARRGGGPEHVAEEKILLAEYALDFALQAANRALLLAMEAIDAQRMDEEGDKISS